MRDFDFDFDEPYLNCCGVPLEGRNRANVESRRELMQEFVSRRGTRRNIGNAGK
jgi:hypothetical protein